MQNTKFYRDILHLGSDWSVTKVETDHAHSKIDIFLKYRRSTAASPETGEVCPIYDRREERSWRHLNTLQYQTYLHARVPRVRQPNGDVVTIRVPWADAHSRHSFDFEVEAIARLQTSKNQTQTARLLQLTFYQMHRIMERAVARGLKIRQREIEQGLASVATTLSIDEKCYRHRHRFITIVSDAATGRVLEVVEGRTTDAGITALARAVPVQDRAAVTAVAMDMAPTYRQAVRSLLPKALIVHDKFHLFQYLTHAIDATRRDEVRSQPLLKETRYLWLKSQRSAPERRLFETINMVNLRTAQAWRIRENFKEMYANCHSIEEAIPYFLQWKDHAISTSIRPMQTVAKMFEKHLHGIVNYFRYPITNARAEQLNSKIKAIIAIAKGFRSADTIRTAIFFFFGNLKLLPQTSQ
jgi:transposase